MIWPFGKKRYLALTGDSRCALLTEVSRTPSGDALPRLLARTDNPITSDVALPRLLAAAGDVRGLVSLSLPLAFFETATVTLPSMPDAVVGRALPYHLAKAIHSPLDNVVYDWQITGRQKDRLQVTVYLFPAGIFQKLRRELLRKEAQLAFFEPDVFSAFAYLGQGKSLPLEDATLCALIWPDSVSLAVHEKNRIPLARVVREEQPSIAFQTEPLEEEIALPTAEKEEELIILEEESSPEPPSAASSRDADSILADFAILSAGASPTETLEEKTRSTASPGSWPDYLQRIILEIMRTRDYYASVQKGASVRNIVVAGANGFWPEFAAQARELLGTEPVPFASPAATTDDHPLLDILARGAGARW